MNSESRTASGDGLLAGFLVVLGLFTVVCAGQIRSLQLGDNHDPGPRIFPMVLGLLLLGGGLWEAGRWWLERRRTVQGNRLSVGQGNGEPRRDSVGAKRSWRELGPAIFRATIVSPGNRDVFIILGALLLYLPAVEWFGFFPSTVLFAGAVLRWLRMSWGRTALTVLVLVLIIQLLFVQLFKVLLPSGKVGWHF